MVGNSLIWTVHVIALILQLRQSLGIYLIKRRDSKKPVDRLADYRGDIHWVIEWNAFWTDYMRLYGTKGNNLLEQHIFSSQICFCLFTWWTSPEILSWEAFGLTPALTPGSIYSRLSSFFDCVVLCRFNIDCPRLCFRRFRKVFENTGVITALFADIRKSADKSADRFGVTMILVNG